MLRRITALLAFSGMLVSQTLGDVPAWADGGNVYLAAPQIRASEILFDTPQGRTFVEMARHQVTHQSQRSSQNFFEKKIKRWGDQSITPQEARLTGSVRFTGMAKVHPMV